MAMKKLLDVFAILKERMELNQRAIRNHLREFVRDAAAAQIAGKEFEMLEREADLLMSLLEANGLDAEDFEANVAAQVKRIRLSELAAQVPSLQAEADRLEAEAKAFGEENLRRYREGLAAHRDMDFAASAAVSRSVAAVAAESDLQAQGEVSADERAASDEKAIVVGKINALRDRLSEIRPWHLGANLAASASEYPRVAMRDATNEIAARKKSARPDTQVNVEGIRRADRIIKIAEDVIRKTEREIADLTKQADAIDARLREFALNRPFEIIRRTKQAAQPAGLVTV